jgi:hypothetical protein
MAKKLEEALYNQANSEEEYCDPSTLKTRLQQLALQMGGKQASSMRMANESRQPLPPNTAPNQPHQNQSQPFIQHNHVPPNHHMVSHGQQVKGNQQQGHYNIPNQPPQQQQPYIPAQQNQNPVNASLGSHSRTAMAALSQYSGNMNNNMPPNPSQQMHVHQMQPFSNGMPAGIPGSNPYGMDNNGQIHPPGHLNSICCH